ncbi:MAG: hypothetical protein IIX71_09190 [Ruminococcus sp.]|nr:hypothetical protein [Ruminococcus sp.]
MKVKVYREHGYFFDAKTGDQYLWRQIDPDKMTFGQKLRRFLCRFGRECHRTAVKAAIYMDYTYRGEEPPLTAEEMRRLHIKPDDKVIVWGASRG